MQSLEKRLIELERTAEKEDVTIIVRFDEPGNMGAEVMGLEAYGDGQSWSRATGESEADFIQRATSETMRLNGYALLIQTFTEDAHAEA
jgi:hypothetical protein